MPDQWGSTIPMNDLNRTVKAEEADSVDSIERGVDVNRIKVSTDLEQTTLKHTTTT